MDIIINQRFGEKQNIPIIKIAAQYFHDTMFSRKERERLHSITISMKCMRNAGEQIEELNLDQKFIININLDRLESFNKIITTLAHEMIHAKQMLSGKLKIMNGEYVWKRKSFGPNPYAKLTLNQIIKNLPWESEAYCKQDRYAREFFNYLFDTYC